MFTLDGPARLAALRATGLLDSAPEQVFDDLTALAARLLLAPSAFLALVDAHGAFVKSRLGDAPPPPVPWCHETVIRGEVFVASDPTHAYVGVPVLAGAQPVGVLCVLDRSPRAWTEDELGAMRTLADLASRELERRGAVERVAALTDELASAQQLLEDAAVKDTLTGLHNRRGFFDQANLALQMSDRTRRPMALFYVDLDGMKAINDAHGHAAGDEALADTAAILRATFRSTDLIARIGGDEFVVLAIECADEASAIGLLQRLHDAITARNQRDGVRFALAASAGMTFYDPARGRRYLESLLAECDQRMYVAKSARKGR